MILMSDITKQDWSLGYFRTKQDVTMLKFTT